MSWLELSVHVDRDQVENLEQVLEQQGALAVTLSDDADDPVLEPGPGETPLWPSVHVRGLFSADIERDGITGALHREAGIHRPERMQWRKIDDQDWERAWLDRFEPMRFGQHLWIVPTGMSIPADRDNVEIKLDPGLAFGTGTHPTTSLCLQWLDGESLQGKRVLDFGCGSGVLGIAAALKGATEVVCVDNDPQALEATASNALRNGVEQAITLADPESFRESEFDVVLANILAGPLIELAPLLTRCTVPGGRLVLSGILSEQEALVSAAYQPVCSNLEIENDDGWLRVVGIRS